MKAYTCFCYGPTGNNFPTRNIWLFLVRTSHFKIGNPCFLFTGGVHLTAVQCPRAFFIFNLRIARVENNLNCRCKVRRYKNNNYVTYTKLYLLLDLLVVRKYQFSWVGGHTVLRLFLCLTSQSASCAAPEGNRGSGPPPPLENHKLYSQVIWVSNKTFYRDPPPPPPTGKCWTLSEIFYN